MASPEKQPKKTKEKRVWAGENAKGKADGLDFSEGKPPEVEDVERVDISAPSRVDEDEDEVYSSDEDEEDRRTGPERVGRPNGARKKSWLGGVMSNALVRGVIGKAALEREDIEPILEKLKINFMNKNVAEDIAERLCESVAGSLRGRKPRPSRASPRWCGWRWRRRSREFSPRNDPSTSSAMSAPRARLDDRTSSPSWASTGLGNRPTCPRWRTGSCSTTSR